MAPATIPTAVPVRLIAGDTWRWDRVLSEYSPADGWTLTVRFRGAGKLDVAGVANSGDSGWECTALATSTAALPAGQYQWEESVSNVGGERYTVASGTLIVAPNAALLAAGAAQPWEERAIACLKAYVEGAADETILEFQIGDRAVKRYSIDEALSTMDRLTDRLARRRTGGRRAPLVPRFVRGG